MHGMVNKQILRKIIYIYNVTSTMSSHCCSNKSEKTLPKKVTCVMLAQNAQDRHVFTGKQLACFLAGSYNITKQSWLFLFIGSEIHLRLVGQ